MPAVYAAALAAVERYGWDAVHAGEREWTALHWAAAEGRTGICRRLIQSRADPRQPDNLGRTPLDYAREAGDQSTWQVLAAACSELQTAVEGSEESSEGAEDRS